MDHFKIPMTEKNRVVFLDDILRNITSAQKDGIESIKANGTPECFKTLLNKYLPEGAKDFRAKYKNLMLT